jgi:predicted ATPase
MTNANDLRDGGGLGENVQRVYEGLGYEIVEVPKDTPDARARFIIGA